LNKKKTVFLIIIIVSLVLSVLLGVGSGAVSVGWRDVVVLTLMEPLGLGGEMDVSPVDRSIVMQLRLPRVLLASAVGASLAVAGAAFQGLFRNPMADPYVVGVSSGAALGAVLAMVLGGTFAAWGFGAVPFFAFVAGVLTIFLVYQMARVGQAVPVMALLLAGIAISAFLSALVSLLTYFAGEKLHQVVFWMMGGFGGATWTRVQVMLPYSAAGFFCIFMFSRELNAMLMGEDTARHLGVNTERVKRVLLVGASLLVAAAVSTSGIIGFVGLAVPHLVRLVAGPDHRFLLPASALLGAALLIAADTLARTVIAPTELPVGIITALVGAPLFIYLLRTHKRLRYFSNLE